jgi:predicted dehydrogenase
MKLPVGLIGLGTDWETRYRPALRALSDRFQVKAVCAEVAQRAENAARDFDAVAVDGFRAIVERADIEALLVLSTDWIGPLPIFAACDTGKAVYSSAAMDIEPTQVHELKKRVDQSGIAFMAELQLAWENQGFCFVMND